MKLLSVLLSGIITSSILAGCSLALAPGEHEGSTPPMMIVRDGAKSWDNGAAFGPVPAEKMETGKRVCSSMNTADKQYKPVGYHSGALDLAGKPIPGGGYLCVRQTIQLGQ